MFELIGIIVFCIVVRKLWFAYTDHSREKINRPIMQERERNLNLLIEDALATIDRVAPNFKYIIIRVWGPGVDNRCFTISNEKNETFQYYYEDHGFAPGEEAKKQLAIAIAQKYDGRWLEKKRDISQEYGRESWITVYYQVIAHDGLKEMEEAQRKKESIRKC